MPPERAQSGTALTGTPAAETRRCLEGKELRHTSYQLLHENLDGVGRNGEVIGEACGVAENDRIESGDREVDGDTIYGWVPYLHRKEENVRRPLTDNKHHRKGSSLMISDRWWRDPAWRAEEVANQRRRAVAAPLGVGKNR
jgi:hypothetical protein